MRIYTCFVLVDSAYTLAGKKKKNKPFLSNLKKQRESERKSKGREQPERREGGKRKSLFVFDS